MRARYVAVGFEKPPAYHPGGKGFVVFDLNIGRNITSQIPAHLSRAFWEARVGDRIRVQIFRHRNGRPYLRNVKRGRREVAREAVVFRFAAIATRAVA